MGNERENTVTLTLQQGYEFLAAFHNFPEAAPLLVDEPAPLGASHGPNAAALLGTAVGNCLAASLLFCLRRSRVEVAGLEAHVSVRVARSDSGRMRVSGIEVALAPELADSADAAKLLRCQDLFEDFCVVTASIRKGIDVRVGIAEPRESTATA